MTTTKLTEKFISTVNAKYRRQDITDEERSDILQEFYKDFFKNVNSISDDLPRRHVYYAWAAFRGIKVSGGFEVLTAQLGNGDTVMSQYFITDSSDENNGVLKGYPELPNEWETIRYVRWIDDKKVHDIIIARNNHDKEKTAIVYPIPYPK